MVSGPNVLRSAVGGEAFTRRRSYKEAIVRHGGIQRPAYGRKGSRHLSAIFRIPRSQGGRVDGDDGQARAEIESNRRIAHAPSMDRGGAKLLGVLPEAEVTRRIGVTKPPEGYGNRYVIETFFPFPAVDGCDGRGSRSRRRR